MAFQPPNSGQERQNLKILEQIEQEKKRLRMKGQPGSPATASISPAVNPVSQASTSSSGNQAMVLPDTQAMNAAQRVALQHANANSVGYFITQDSSFGNLILPVLPRFEK